MSFKDICSIVNSPSQTDSIDEFIVALSIFTERKELIFQTIRKCLMVSFQLTASHNPHSLPYALC